MQLPEDVLLAIAEHLELREIYRLTLVNKYYRSILIDTRNKLVWKRAGERSGLRPFSAMKAAEIACLVFSDRCQVRQSRSRTEAILRRTAGLWRSQSTR